MPGAHHWRQVCSTDSAAGTCRVGRCHLCSRATPVARKHSRCFSDTASVHQRAGRGGLPPRSDMSWFGGVRRSAELRGFRLRGRDGSSRCGEPPPHTRARGGVPHPASELRPPLPLQRCAECASSQGINPAVGLDPDRTIIAFANERDRYTIADQHA